MYHMMHFVDSWSVLTSMYALWEQRAFSSCSSKHYLEQRRGSVNTYGMNGFIFAWEKVLEPLQPHTSAHSLRSPRDPAKSGAVRRPFCSIPRCSACVAWLVSGSTSLFLSRQAAHVSGSVYAQTEELQQRYEGDPSSRARGMRGTHLPSTCSFCMCSIWWHNLQTP